MYYPLYERQIMMVGRVGFEPTVLFRDAIMSRGPATNTASGPSFKYYMLLSDCCQANFYQDLSSQALPGSGADCACFNNLSLSGLLFNSVK